MGEVAESVAGAALRRVVVATQHALLGEGLAALLERDGRLSARWCGIAGSGADDPGAPVDIVLLDASVDAVAAWELCRMFKDRSPDAAVVLLDGEDPTASNRLASAVDAVGVLSTRMPGDSLTDALLRVSGGERLGRALEPRAVDAHPTRLTQREREVLTELAAGRSPDEIAATLSISPHTVRTHIENAMARLGAGSRLEAVALLRQADAELGPPDHASFASRPVATTAPGPLGIPRGETAEVVIAADATIFRDALRATLERVAGVRVVGEATSIADLQAVMVARNWSIAVIDETVRGGVVSACALVKSCDDPPRVLVTSRAPDQTVLLAAVEAGADGYLTRGAGLEQLAEAVHRVRNGEASIPPRMLGALLRNLIDRRREEDEAVERLSTLTRRERTVLGLLVEGLDQEQIATRLVVSPHTARTHVQNVLRKLQVHSRLEAVSLVTTHNLHERFELNAKAG